jgi:hypothetical protein
MGNKEMVEFVKVQAPPMPTLGEEFILLTNGERQIWKVTELEWDEEDLQITIRLTPLHGVTEVDDEEASIKDKMAYVQDRNPFQKEVPNGPRFNKGGPVTDAVRGASRELPTREIDG